MEEKSKYEEYIEKLACPIIENYNQLEKEKMIIHRILNHLMTTTNLREAKYSEQLQFEIRALKLVTRTQENIKRIIDSQK